MTQCKHDGVLMRGWAMDTNENQLEWTICTSCGLNYDYKEVKRND